MNASTTTRTLPEYNITITTTKALCLYGFQSNEWHILIEREVIENGKKTYDEEVRCNRRGQAHSIKENVVPTVNNVTCDKCLKALKRAAK